MALPSDGTLNLDLGGEPYYLVPNLRLARAVTASKWGDPFRLIDAMRGMDPDAFAFIVHTASGASGKPSDKLVNAVFDHGMMQLINPLSTLLLALANGGRAPNSEAQEQPGNE